LWILIRFIGRKKKKKRIILTERNVTKKKNCLAAFIAFTGRERGTRIQEEGNG